MHQLIIKAVSQRTQKIREVNTAKVSNHSPKSPTLFGRISYLIYILQTLPFISSYKSQVTQTRKQEELPYLINSQIKNVWRCNTRRPNPPPWRHLPRHLPHRSRFLAHCFRRTSYSYSSQKVQTRNG